MSTGDVVLGAFGAFLVLVALVDLFLTIFNYDGFSSLAHGLHRLLWRVMRATTRPLPDRARHTALSRASPSATCWRPAGSTARSSTSKRSSG